VNFDYIKLILIDAAKKSKQRTFSVQQILQDKKFKDIFEKDPNSPDKVFCKYCKKTYKPRACDLKEHLATNKHKIASEKDYPKNISEFTLGKSIARSEIIWAYLTVFRNLSFNFQTMHLTISEKCFQTQRLLRNKP